MKGVPRLPRRVLRKNNDVGVNEAAAEGYWARATMFKTSRMGRKTRLISYVAQSTAGCVFGVITFHWRTETPRSVFTPVTATVCPASGRSLRPVSSGTMK